MAGTVKLPGLGEVKTGYVWAGAALVVVIVGYAWYRHSRNAASAATAATAASAGTAATAADDPETGYPEGSPEDLAALSELSAGDEGYGYGSDVGASETGALSGDLYYDPADGLYDLTSPYTGSSATASTGNTGPGTFTDNAYWTQYAIDNVQGYSGSDIQAALAIYLAGQGLTTTQMSIYQQALAVAGPPPQPPAQPAHLATQTTGTTTTSTGGTTTTKVKVPNVTGMRVNPGEAALKAAGLTYKVNSGGPRNPKDEYEIWSQTPGGGQMAAKGSNVDLAIKQEP